MIKSSKMGDKPWKFKVEDGRRLVSDPKECESREKVICSFSFFLPVLEFEPWSSRTNDAYANPSDQATDL
jgi:hypothetical protein